MNENIRRGINWLQDHTYILNQRIPDNVICHHGIPGQKWGVRNGPPYPLDKSVKRSKVVMDAIKSGEISMTINREKQKRHTLKDHTPGRSYLNGECDYAQELVNKYHGTGTALMVNKKWNHRERIKANEVVGVYVSSDGDSIESDNAIIIYSKTGTHVYPVRKDDSDD